MDQVEIKRKVKAVIEKYSAFGEVSDVWLNADVMATLDSRPPLARVLEEPCKIGDVYVSAFSELREDEFRVAFVTNFGEALNEFGNCD